MINPTQKFPLGELLIQRGIITKEQLDLALRKQKETGELLGVVLLALGFVNEETVFLPVLAGQMGVEYVNLKDRSISIDVVRKIPAKFAMHYKIMPFECSRGTLSIATRQPLDVHMLDELGVVVSEKIQASLASDKEISEAIRKYYGVGAETIEKMMGTVQIDGESKDESILEEIDSEASIGKFINQIVIEAFRQRATDVHIEPYEDTLKIRYRVDGVLKDAEVPSNIRLFKESINSRIKILSNLNIAEKRLPQDGRFKVRFKEFDIDLRVSFIPTAYGESVVLRILNTSNLYVLEDLGLSKEETKILEALIVKPHGVIFLTGPTGSGKTTTLYSALSRVNTPDKKIITIEDPVEYQLKGITQIQVNSRVGLTFAQGLRSCLRHDPDIMMVGEVRDIETAEIAIQAALTGHLIFSTLHTNDAVGGIARLVDMGVEPYLLTNTVECFIAQRLVRVLCPKCKKRVELTSNAIRDFGEAFIQESQSVQFYEPLGCEACNFTGYNGRVGIYEFLLVTEAIKELIVRNASGMAIKDKALEQGMRTLRQAGWEKIKLGLTSFSEVVRVTQEEK